MKISETVNKVNALGVDKVGAEKVNAKVESASSQAAGNAQTPAASSEKVTLSPLSSKLQSLEAKVASSSVFDTDKVEAIKSAIASGQFAVDSGKVADSLIQSVSDLLTSRVA